MQEITRLLGLKEEIFIATPKQKTEVPITVFDYDNQDIKVRKAVVAPDSPIQCVRLEILLFSCLSFYILSLFLGIFDDLRGPIERDVESTEKVYS